MHSHSELSGLSKSKSDKFVGIAKCNSHRWSIVFIVLYILTFGYASLSSGVMATPHTEVFGDEYTHTPAKGKITRLERAAPLAVILYHKRTREMIPSRWIKKCLKSLASQGYQDFDLVELNYHDQPERSLRDEYGSLFPNKRWEVLYTPLANHSVAMNYLLDRLFGHVPDQRVNGSYKAVANVNLDDFYHRDRFRIQWDHIAAGADVVTSPFRYVREDPSRRDKYIKNIPVRFQNINELRLQLYYRNVIAHPVVMYARTFWRKHEDIEYRHEIPIEDYLLWKRAAQYNDIKIVCVPHYLLFYRLHNEQISGRNG